MTKASGAKWDDGELTRLSLHITQILAFIMAIVAASRSIRFVMGTLLGVEYSGGNTNWTGVSGIVLLFSASLSTFWFGRFSSRYGYRRLLGWACLWGVLSSLVGLWSSFNHSLSFLLMSFLITGLSHGILPMSRYAAAEATASVKKSRAMGLVIFGAAIGSTFGPLGMDVAGRTAEALGFSIYNGAWILEALLFFIAWIGISWGLRCEPKEVARDIELKEGRPQEKIKATGKSLSFAVWCVMGVMAFSQVAMVLVMSITPIHMQHGGHGMGAVTWTISGHMFGMFGLSYPIGWLADKWGTRTIVWGGALVLLIACLLTYESHSMVVMVAGLFLLGLGWNGCFIGGSRLLLDVAPAGTLPKVQGINEGVILIVSGVTVLGSGFLYTYTSFSFMCGMGVGASVLTVLWLILLPKKSEVLG